MKQDSSVCERVSEWVKEASKEAASEGVMSCVGCPEGEQHSLGDPGEKCRGLDEMGFLGFHSNVG